MHKSEHTFTLSLGVRTDRHFKRGHLKIFFTITSAPLLGSCDSRCRDLFVVVLSVISKDYTPVNRRIVK